ncbi:MAG: DUF2851 family protein [Bacteroidota bacterium]
MSREALLQYIWKNRIMDRHPLVTTCGKQLTILSAGDQNVDAGPDFFNAKITIGTITWSGNVEVHNRASDWDRHGHHLDPAYDNVILHVVAKEERSVFNSHGRKIQTLVFEYPLPLFNVYRTLQLEESWLPCHSYIHQTPKTVIRHWLTILQGERLRQKTLITEHLIDRHGLSWDASLYRILASGFGLPINSLPFEMTTAATPYELLLRYRDNPDDLEAILFGRAGFLQRQSGSGPYRSGLCRRYREYAANLPGEDVSRHLWKFLRLRPASFPTLRIAQFASLVHLRFPLLDPILESTSVTPVEQLFRVRASEYWNTHYMFDKCSPESPKYPGHQFIRTLMINAVVPFLFAMGRRKNHIRAIDLGTSLIQEMEAESNQIIKRWSEFGITPEGAFESQALIHLHNVYCKQKRCLDCLIGRDFIKRIT